MKLSQLALPAAWAAAALLIGIALYVGGYFALGEMTSGPLSEGKKPARFFRSEWQANLFRPAGLIENKFTGQPAYIAYEEFDRDAGEIYGVAYWEIGGD
jgi:hypothetical protein